MQSRRFSPVGNIINNEVLLPDQGRSTCTEEAAVTNRVLMVPIPRVSDLKDSFRSRQESLQPLQHPLVSHLD